MLRLFWKLYWKISGWKIAGQFPYHYKKMVLVIAPHTSWTDVLIGYAARNELNIRHARFMAKKELFVGPLGWILRKSGGTPVDRFSKHGVVEQIAALFAANENFILGMAPEGTRKRVNKLRSGFYHIAKQAKVPMVPIGLDFGNKRLVVGEAFFAGDDEAADFKKIVSFFANIKGKHPSSDLRHLKDQ